MAIPRGITLFKLGLYLLSSLPLICCYLVYTVKNLDLIKIMKIMKLPEAVVLRCYSK